MKDVIYTHVIVGSKLRATVAASRDKIGVAVVHPDDQHLASKKLGRLESKLNLGKEIKVKKKWVTDTVTVLDLGSTKLRNELKVNLLDRIHKAVEFIKEDARKYFKESCEL